MIRRALAVGVLGLAAAFALAGWAIEIAAIHAPAPAVPAVSREAVDRDGRLLRAFPLADGRWRLATAAADVDPLFLRLLLAYEDRRFYAHGGIDALALARAAAQILWAGGRIVSGGSTLTMQAARLNARLRPGDAGDKLRQIIAARALERRADKAAILDLYLTLAPYGGNLEGARAASYAWFGKPPTRLSIAEAALLVALPQSPEARRPDRHAAAARAARNRVIARAVRAGAIDADAGAAAMRAPVPTRRRPLPAHAAHAAARAAARNPDAARVRLAVDGRAQARLEALARERGASLASGATLALVAMELASGRSVAEIGALDPFDDARAGWLDMTRAKRSPGSTLKPLIYGLAFEAGIAHPDSLISDRPTGFSGYAPENFDRVYRGDVTVREALQWSLNTPAAQLLDQIGPARLMARLRRAGAAPAVGGDARPGLAVGLGGVGLTLRELAALFGAIGRGGTAMTPVLTLDSRTGDLGDLGDPRTGAAVDDAAGEASDEASDDAADEAAADRAARMAPARVLSREAAWRVADILAGAPRPAAAVVDGVAFKTGTSWGHRDAWAIGFDGRLVVGVWVGRADGAPIEGLSGLNDAAPILLDAFSRLGPRAPLPARPAAVSTADAGRLPAPLRRAGTARRPAGARVGPPPEIAFPPDGAEVELSGDGWLALKVRAGRAPFHWFANGAPIPAPRFDREARWRADGRGFAILSVVDADGESAQAQVRLR